MANGNGWFGKRAAMWRKVPSGPMPMHGGKRKLLHSNSGKITNIE
jgi:hypothetical protein